MAVSSRIYPCLQRDGTKIVYRGVCRYGYVVILAIEVQRPVDLPGPPCCSVYGPVIATCRVAGRCPAAFLKLPVGNRPLKALLDESRIGADIANSSQVTYPSLNAAIGNCQHRRIVNLCRLVYAVDITVVPENGVLQSEIARIIPVKYPPPVAIGAIPADSGGRQQNSALIEI